MRCLVNKRGNYCPDRGVQLRIRDVINAPSVLQLNKLENEYLLLLWFLLIEQLEACFESTGLRRRCLRNVKLKVEVIIKVLRTKDWVEFESTKVALGTVPLQLRVF